MNIKRKQLISLKMLLICLSQGNGTVCAAPSTVRNSLVRRWNDNEKIDYCQRHDFLIFYHNIYI